MLHQIVDSSVNDQLVMVWMEGVHFKDYPGIFLDKQRQPQKASIEYPVFELRFEPRTARYEVTDQ